MTEIIELIEEAAAAVSAKKESKNKEDALKEHGKKIRQAAMQGMQQCSNSDNETDSDELEPKKKRKKGTKQAGANDLMSYLKEKSEREAAIRERELKLAEDKFKAENEERKKMMEIMAQVIQLEK